MYNIRCNTVHGYTLFHRFDCVCLKITIIKCFRTEEKQAKRFENDDCCRYIDDYSDSYIE